MSGITEQELLQFLAAIEDGHVTLEPQDDPQDVYAGNVRYVASNGWKITIFNDANEWDYIDTVECGDGQKLDFNEIEQMPTASDYEPNADVSWDRYRIPGHMRFRCYGCGAKLKDGPPFRLPYWCRGCRDRKPNKGMQADG